MMKIIKLDSATDADALLEMVHSTKEGSRIMRDKMQCEFFFIKDLRTPAANILKQDALSIGAELAVEKDTILCKDETIDAVLIVNEKQRKILSKKESIQPFGLKKLAAVLGEHKPVKKTFPTIMGVINANDDSFFAASRFQGKDAMAKIEQMIEEGADVIDVGGVSSRPGSLAVSEEDELARIKPVVDMIASGKLTEKARFSIDSYAPKPIAYALERGFTIVNDITGLANDEVCKITALNGAEAVIMHMQNNPMTMQLNPEYAHVISDIDLFFSERLEKAERYGIKKVVLDVGIGFGKLLKDNLMLIKHLGHFHRFGKPLLIGASRKSMIDMIVPSPVEERLPGTLALHLKAVEEGADIVRCHDVKEHYQALKVQQALMETLV
jgi:dihydropteroate synthase